MENKIRNKIITISGEPVSGKGTTTKVIVKKLKEKGFLEENIHIISAGKEFRKYFESILNFIKEVDNLDELNNSLEDEKIDEILNNKEYRAALISTIVNIKKQNIDLNKVDIQDLNEAEVFSEMRAIIDHLLDSDMQKMGKEINKEKRENEVWIFDSRMAFYNIPEAFSVRLTANAKVAGERLFNDSTRGKEDIYSSVEEAEQERENRRITEIKRYKKLYNVDLEDKDNYDLIIDTSYSSVEDIADTILECEKCYEEEKYFGKTWQSPLKMIPCQDLMETYNPQPGSSLTLENLKDDILEVGYYPDSEIEIYRINGIDYISEGHHRNFASIWAGKTLVPYIDLMETEDGKKRIQNGWKPTTTLGKLYDHEELIFGTLKKQNNKEINFSYQEMYPNIIEEIEKENEISR